MAVGMTNTEQNPIFKADLPGNDAYYLKVNAETGVQYLCNKHWIGMVILVDADGKPILYGNTELMPVVANRFFKIPFKKRRNELIVDSVTRVQYLRIYEDGMALYADAEGKPILYEGPIPPVISR